MKKKIIFIIGIAAILLVIMGIPYSLSAQEISSISEIGNALPKEQTLYSPQAMGMMRYDGTSILQNTGRVNLSIPLVEWKDKDFDLPISLSYNSAGFRPREVDNFVGRNWTLDIGGVVYRHVNGVPDDIDFALEPLSAQIGVEIRTSGFLNILNKGYFNLKRMEKEFEKDPYRYTRRRDFMTSESTLTGVVGDIESSADVFYFSFGKHSGKFIINYDGSVSACGKNGGVYEVDLSGMAIFGSKDAHETRIRIKTDDGYVYTFGGGGYSSLEYNIGWEGALPLVHGDLNKQNEITAYHLTEVKAPNGRKMTISYRDINKIYHNTPAMLKTLISHGSSLNEDIAMQYSLSVKAVFRNYNLHPKYYLEHEALQPTQKKYTLTKNALIDRISIDETNINFHYTSRNQHIDYGEGAFVNELTFPYICGAKLDRIEMRTSSVSQTAAFAYSYKIGGRMFLQDVQTSGRGLYSFSYNNLNNLVKPTPFTSNIDYWGFWRGGMKNGGIVPAISADSYFPQVYTITSNDREPTGENYDYSLLNQVTYPTGGKTVFEYEANRYSRIPNKAVRFSSYQQMLYERNKLAGGARVRSVTQYIQNDEAVKKSIFTYGEDLTMGDILYMPHYTYIGTFKLNSSQYEIQHVAIDSEGITDLPFPSTHILYPIVTEHFVHPTDKDLSKAHPYKTTVFGGHNAYTADDFTFPTYKKEESMEAVWPDRIFPTYEFKEYNKRLLEHPTLDATLQYGKIMEERYYNADQKLILYTDYKYKYINRDKYAMRTYAPCPFFRLRTALYTHFVKEPLFSFVLEKKTTTAFSDPGNLSLFKQDVECYSYDRDGYLDKKSILKSNGDSLITYYPHRLAGTSSCIQVLSQGESTYLVSKNGNVTYLWDNILSYRILFSSANESWFVPERQILYNPDYQFVSGVEYRQYDIYGNALETLNHAGKKVTNIWGFEGQYLLACVENASYEEVSKALGTNLEDYSKNRKNYPELDRLRQELPFAKVYTYTYTKGVGMVSETSPDGQATFYEYDFKGRLISRYRIGESGKREIIQLYNYHIINE